MEVHADGPTEDREVARIGQSDTRNVSDTPGPESTESTVDRRASATSTHFDPTTTHETEAFVEPFPEEGLPSAPEEAPISNETSRPDEDEDLGAEEEQQLCGTEETMQPRQSSRSIGSFEEEDHSTITLRSRSDSSGTFSSSDGSAQVDWDELEKEEDQAPRDEGSDEVSFPPTCKEQEFLY